MFAGMLTKEGTKPYKKPSNRKYPKIMVISANMPLNILDGSLLIFFESRLNPTQKTTAIEPFITNVAGAYTIYPKKTSASAEPMPAVRNL